MNLQETRLRYDISIHSADGLPKGKWAKVMPIQIITQGDAGYCLKCGEAHSPDELNLEIIISQKCDGSEPDGQAAYLCDYCI